MKNAFAHVLWIGGATDSGKTTIAQIIAERYNLQRCHYDQRSNAYLEKKAQRWPLYRNFLDASVDERWVDPDPGQLLAFVLQSFHDSFPLVVADLMQMPAQPLIIAEGFGLMTDLVHPVLSNKHQAVWLIPTADFKWASMKRRDKPSFKKQASDPEKATQNLYQRDMLIAEQVKAQAQTNALPVCEVDGSRSVTEMAGIVAQHFQPYLYEAKQ